MYEHKLCFIEEKFSGWPRVINHLVGVAEILKEQGAPEYLQIAGLYHSIYGERQVGNFGYSLITREELQELIGIQAEEVVHTWCDLEAPRTDNIHNMSDSQLKSDLLKLEKANIDEMKS